MLLQSPLSLHYPITVTELLKRPNDDIERFDPLFSYFYKSSVTEGNEFGEEWQVEKTFPTRFESETDGKVLKWHIKEGSVIAGPNVDLIEIEEPCRHAIQYGGICVDCGKDMTEVDYNTSLPDSYRANINVAHGNTALKVSREEATRGEQEAKRRLLASKKLSLVVDLDQTIIHATVDPTVAEWQDDENNPNHDAVADVRSFQLLDEGPGRGCWYYIKLRPGLTAFLENISKIYELHIYTMATRAYALNIAKIIDPQRKMFGDRILSRDESGSLTAKNLQRLFPVDTKMVVIIDDRGDVWNWSDNLIRVQPYDFFVGIGDINSTFLPKRIEVVERERSAASIEAAPILVDVPADGVTVDESKLTGAKDALEAVSNGVAEAAATTNGENPALDQLVSMGGSSDPESIREKSDKQDVVLNAQRVDRPLAQKQNLLDKIDEEEKEQSLSPDPQGDVNELQQTDSQRHRHNLLHDDDSELKNLEDALTNVHDMFYTTFEKTLTGAQGSRVAQLRGEKVQRKRPEDELDNVPDIKVLMPSMKQQVLKDVVLTFSGVVPLGINVYSSDLGRWAMSFGASINLEVETNTTHVIATKLRRTAKVRQAARDPRIKIVTQGWLQSCCSQWRLVDESPYIIEVEPEKGHVPPVQHTPSFDEELLDGTLSSSEDEEGSGNKTRLRPTIKLNLNSSVTLEIGEDDADEEPFSPIDRMTADDWAAMQAEIEEELGSDDESDLESSNSDADNVAVEDTSRKRKRGTPSPAASDNEEDKDVVNGLGSELQRRKKRALERTSSLTNVTTTNEAVAGLATSNGTNAARLAAVVGDEDDEDGDDAAFEAEFAAQLDADDDDEDGEDEGS